jgi:DNA-binding beta-propeller fold protein YncE
VILAAMTVRRALARLAALGTPVLLGCGSQSVHDLPPAAEPERAPVATVAAAGRVVKVGPGPEGLAVDARGDRAAVALRDGRKASLAIVDTRSGRVLRRVGLPGAPRHLAFDARHGAFLVPAEPADRLLSVTPAGRVLRDTRVGAHPHDVAASGGRVFAGDERGDAVTVLRGERVVRTLRVAAQPGGVLVTPDGRSLAVVSVRERVLELYDLRTLRRTARIAVGVGPTHLAGMGGHLYVTDTRGGALLVVALGRRPALVRRVFLPGGPYGIAVDAARKRLWVTLSGRNELVELPAHGRPHVLRRFPTVRQPDSVAVVASSGRVLVTGRVGGVLQLLDP